LPEDLYCRDLKALGYQYPEAALYWSILDMPTRMDADDNGIPCETVYSSGEVVAFWGEPVASGDQGVADIAAWVQRWYENAYLTGDPPEEVIGPLQIQCRDSGPVSPGTVFVCRGVPQTVHEESLDTAGLLILVLDPAGTAIWSAGTSGPGTTAALRYAYHVAPKGLTCEDLLDPEVNAGLFSGYASPPDDAFFLSMVYWYLEGMPPQMDPDGGGIPCEHLYEDSRLELILEGGPVPLYIR